MLTNEQRLEAYQMVQGIVWKRFPLDVDMSVDRNELAHQVYVDFLARIEGIYDESKGKLSTFVWKYTSLRLRGLTMKRIREVPLERFDADEGEWVNVVEPTSDPREDIEFELLVETVRKNVDAKSKEHPQHGKLELRIFDAIVDRVRANMEVNVMEIAEELGISGAGVTYYIENKLRSLVKDLQ